MDRLNQNNVSTGGVSNITVDGKCYITKRYEKEKDIVMPFDCTASGGAFGFWVMGCDGGYVDNIATNNTGTIPYSSGTTAVGVYANNDFEIRNSDFGWNKRSGGPDGCGFDFEGKNNNYSTTLTSKYFQEHHQSVL